MSGINSLHDELRDQPIPTNSKVLDDILCGGVRMRTISDVYGTNFKTQFCLQLTISTIIPKPDGLVNGEVIWISKRNDALKKRLESLCDNFHEIYNLKSNVNLLKSVRLKFIDNIPELLGAIYELKDFVKENKNIRLIVIDSFAFFVRRIEDNLEKIRVMYEFCDCLETISTTSPCAVILVNDIVNDFNSNTGSMKASLGDSFAHRIHQRFFISESFRKDKVLIDVQKNFAGSPGCAVVRFTEKIGFIDIIEDSEEDEKSFNDSRNSN